MGARRHGTGGSVERIVAVVLAVLVVGGTAVAGVAVFSTGGAAASTANGATASSNPIKFVYVDQTTNHVTFVRADGTKVETNRSADVVGSMGDLDGDGNLEAPFVTSQGEIWTIDANNETQFIADQTYSSSTKLTIADWTGDGTQEILYANTSDNNYLYYANTSGTPTQIAAESAYSVLGVADYTSSEERRLMYVGTSSKNLWYYNSSSGATNTNWGNLAEKSTAGAPAEFYRSGGQWVPAIDGSGYVKLVNASGDVRQITDSNVDKTPVAGVDWTGDSQLEVIVIKSGVIEYTYLNGTRKTLYDASNNSISANQGAGIAGVAARDETVLSVSNFHASATGEQNVTVELKTSEELSSLNVTLSGPENVTLTLGDGDFSTSDSTAPYTYTATYNGSSDGAYTATLHRVESTDGDFITNAQNDTATVDARSPTIDSVSLSDATDSNGVVDGSDTVRVTATVTGDVGTVSADLSAFGAGSVTLTHASGDTYEATAQVDAGTTDGNYAVTVTARDGQGNQVVSTTGTLEVDTADLSVSLGSGKRALEGEQLSFSPQSVSNADGNVIYDWAFGDGSSETGESVTHVYVSPGSYTVTLTVTNADGDSAQATMTVDVVSLDNPETTSTSTTTATTTATTTPTTTATTPTDQTTTTEHSDTTTAPATTTPDNTATTSAGTTTDEANTQTTEDDDDGGGAIGEAPGFGLGLALVAMVGAALLARRE